MQNSNIQETQQTAELAMFTYFSTSGTIAVLLLLQQNIHNY
mgnify:CR=1 FL=1